MATRKRNNTNNGNGDYLHVKGAREHNLRNIDVKIPRNTMTVITGLSGSGKSSLAFDTIYAEGQRRYVESLSSYARQFLGLMEKPDVDFIEGLSPAISIEQKGAPKNPRSTVGTVTEIYDYLRLLFARVGVPHCTNCDKPITQQTVEQIVDSVLTFEEGTRMMVLAPLVRGKKGEHQEIIDEARAEGFVRLRIDDQIVEADEEIELDKKKKHSIEAVVDRLVVKTKSKRRLADSVETALKIGQGTVLVNIKNQDLLFSEKFACLDCNISYDEPSPRLFSFNSPFGACSTCDGLGQKMEIDPKMVIPDTALSISDGAIKPWGGADMANWYRYMLRGLSRHYNFKLSTKFDRLPKKIQDVILNGSGKEEIEFEYEHTSGKGRGGGIYRSKFEGVIPHLERRYKQTESSGVRNWIEGFMAISACPTCKGSRLRPEARKVIIDRETIDSVTEMSIKQAVRFFDSVNLTKRQKTIARQILKEVRQRLQFLADVGLDYLTLARTASTLSGGEVQRIRLATQIGSRLVGVLYILDEPSIGLHQRDNRRLLNTLLELRDLGNTVLVVEHDRETIEEADFVVDLGPGAGVHGGAVVAIGTPKDIKATKNSITGQYLADKRVIAVPHERREPNGNYIHLWGAEGNNLKRVDVEIPLGLFVAVTGVSGSGKSTLINETLYRILAREFYHSRTKPLAYERIDGLEHIDKVIDIDQSPIGRTPRSNPATYTGVFTPIRDLFSGLPESKARGYAPGRFSFNVKGGRCEACEGDGIIKIEMHFLPDVYVPCEICKGKRYNRETLEITYKGKNIADVLDMTVEEALTFFESIPIIKKKLLTLKNVGLGYIHLGQQATTLSGGEAQRVKLATELSKMATGRTLYILDEPTTGLHFEDIRMLLTVLNELVDRGNTVVVIEHNLDVIKTADWIIDIGPEGGDDGGRILATGTPEDVAEVKKSYTGQYLKGLVKKKNMPELPEVETVVRGLRGIVVGRTIEQVRTNAPTSSIVVSPTFKRRSFSSLLKGKAIRAVGRRGKNILIQLDNEITLWVHLKMTGHFFWQPRTQPIDKHDLVIFDFLSDASTNGDDGYHLRFNDYRRFGRLRLFRNDELWLQDGLKNIGPEPLEISAVDFVTLLHNSKRMIKPALMDQSFIAGIGNIYADESLHFTRIHPKRMTSSISKRKLIELHGEIQRLLKRSIELMGTSVDTYSGVNGQTGKFQTYLTAYNREGEPCQFCGHAIRREKIGSRSAHYCPRCQRVR